MAPYRATRTSVSICIRHKACGHGLNQSIRLDTRHTHWLYANLTLACSDRSDCHAAASLQGPRWAQACRAANDNHVPIRLVQFVKLSLSQTTYCFMTIMATICGLWREAKRLAITTVPVLHTPQVPTPICRPHMTANRRPVKPHSHARRHIFFSSD